ncbi:hypothetical protein K469DRAFT_709941 [Zopfia rhizophila CBS 207.26]|uniref:non-specific serine/threonine protein kinase n=1 Tax=Zopfia rhizophila CBS 207.26 TaxID=1314779 RepID=A0A6A6E0R1_9PEZI|nr:hypothetical protein K469DRAFT_709941 [Zopfia rhizophila CBS 207.26]
MPPKQVYGKRTNRTAVNYSKFLSPDKECLLQGPKTTPTNEATKKRQMRKQEAIVATEQVEQQLEALTIQDKPAAVEREMIHEVRDGKKTTRKALRTKDTNMETKEYCRTEEAVEKQTSRRRAKSPQVVIRVKKENTNIQHEEHTMVLPISTSIASQPPDEDVYTRHITSLLSFCHRPQLTSFADWSSELDPHFDIIKIAEASYGEVYRLSLKPSVTIPGFSRTDESVLKIIAIKSPLDAPTPIPCSRESKRTRGKPVSNQNQKQLVDRQEKETWMSDVEGIKSEVQLLQHLTPIPGFTNFRDLLIIQGRPPPPFITAWKTFNKSRKRGQKSVFPDPSKKASYDDTQLWAVIEMQDAGTDLEKLIEEGGMGNIWEIWDVFWGVCLSVGKGEEECRFEHRDLHLGNICIRPKSSAVDPTEPWVTRPLTKKLGFTGLETTIIDYTLSRADMSNPSQAQPDSPSSSSSLSTSSTRVQEPDVAYLDLDKDPAVFEGDADEEYQYEIYRYMRSIVYHSDPLRPYLSPASECYTPEPPRRPSHKTPKKSLRPQKDIWKQFHPKTNLIWLHFLLFKLLQNLTFPSSVRAEKVTQQVEETEREVLDKKTVHKKAVKLERVLRKVEAWLEPEVLGKEDGLGCVRDLIVVALEEGWLGEEDVVGDGVEEYV